MFNVAVLPILYAHRAAAYKNSGDYMKALEDANRAIELSPESPDGYLQAVTALQLQGTDGQGLVSLENLLHSSFYKAPALQHVPCAKAILRRTSRKEEWSLAAAFCLRHSQPHILSFVFQRLCPKRVDLQTVAHFL